MLKNNSLSNNNDFQNIHVHVRAKQTLLRRYYAPNEFLPGALQHVNQSL